VGIAVERHRPACGVAAVFGSSEAGWRCKASIRSCQADFVRAEFAVILALDVMEDDEPTRYFGRMSDVSMRYQTIADGFTERVESITAEQWAAPTPCPEWTVRDLVAHVIGTHRRVLATLDDTEPTAVDVDRDLVHQWLAATNDIADAVHGDAQSSKVVKSIFSEQPFESLVGTLLCADTLVHTWDLARATGQDETLDADAIAKAREFLTTIDEPMRRPGGFAPKVEPTTGVDDQTEFLNFVGREV
jgi:uncharacterized protein (TIGR03086 family)